MAARVLLSISWGCIYILPTYSGTPSLLLHCSFFPLPSLYSRRRSSSEEAEPRHYNTTRRRSDIEIPSHWAEYVVLDMG
ncbi:hypothetical protein F4678DRAFT_142637 [Xylaria arbuscula]|nr:hypothetical protein F4678DRAFT_142637 [Xylaria arbuscula]